MAARTSTCCTRSLRRAITSRTYLKSASLSQTPFSRQDSTSQRTYHSSRPQAVPNTLSPFQSRHASSTSSSSPLKTLPLNDFHLSHNAKMVPFADHSMPLVYSDQTHLQSHHWTRTKASLFDVGHMLQHTFSGPGAEGLLHKVTPAYLPALAPFQSTLSVLLHPKTGGIVDDTMITKLDQPNTYRLVTNGATAGKVTNYLERELSSTPNDDIQWSTNHSHNSGLLALQGPLSAEILTSLLSPLDSRKLRSLFFGQSSYFPLRGVYGPPILVSRGGYTGEDGFELATTSPEQTVELANALWTAGGEGEKLRLAGLGARDSLRLEAGMCLYGHDLDDSTTPVEASLGWVVAKERRSEGGSGGGFHGAEIILPQLIKKSDGGIPPGRKRIGLIIDGVPAREGAKIVSAEDTAVEIGLVTSGGPSPTTGKNIAMGYVVNKSAFSKMGSEVKVLVRGKARSATVVKMPFVEAKYYRVLVEGEVKKESIKDAATTGAAPM